MSSDNHANNALNINNNSINQNIIYNSSHRQSHFNNQGSNIKDNRTT